MTSWVVADSGIYLAIALKEPQAKQAQALIERWRQILMRVAAPYLFRYEVVSVIRKHIARGYISLEDGTNAVNELTQLPVTFYSGKSIADRAFELANEHNRPSAYDSFYLALAEQLQCEFWTADLKLFNAVSQKLAWVKWLGNFFSL
jgi:predicted nucleic acid-binding protein